MTIRDMETISGLTRANIRFYEAQGLIAPGRMENNYREYSEADGEILLRIKLLRALGMTLEQIKALQSGAEDMLTALDRQIEILSRQQEQLYQSQRVCREMRSDNVRYETLDARRYLNSLDNPPRQTDAVIYQDVEPPVFAPWQRYWARTLDGLIYAWILMTAATWMAGGLLPEWGSILSTVLGFAMTLILEPIQLRLVGTTLGKWIFGIRVTDMDGRKLSLKDGFWRTMNVIIYGQGLGVIGFDIWRHWKSYKAYERNEFLPWNDPSELTIRDKKPLRYVAAIAAAAALFGLSVVSMSFAQLPEHQNDLTVAQFCENYRKIANQNGWDNERFILQDDGTWIENPQSGTFYVDMSINYFPLALQFTAEDGIVTGVSFSEEIAGTQENGWIGSRTTQMRLTALSLLMAQPDYSILAGDEEAVLTAINEHPFESFRLSSCGLEIICDVEITGYWVASGGYLIEDDDPNTTSSYAMTFAVTKVE